MEEIRKILPDYELDYIQYQILKRIEAGSWLNVKETYLKQIKELDEDELLEYSNLYGNSIRITDKGKNLLQTIEYDLKKTNENIFIKSYICK